MNKVRYHIGAIMHLCVFLVVAPLLLLMTPLIVVGFLMSCWQEFETENKKAKALKETK